MTSPRSIPEAVIRIGEGTVAMWSLALGPKLDFLAHLGRDEAGRFHYVCRIREHVDELIFDSRDKKSWYEIAPREGEDVDEPRFRAACRAVFDTMQQRFGCPGWELERGGRTVEEFAQELQRMPGMSFRKESV